jgi:archaellum component FlaC
MNITIRVDHYFHGSDPYLAAINEKLDRILKQGEHLMADATRVTVALQTLSDTTNQLADVVDTVIADDKTREDALRQQIDDLKAQLAAGDAVTQAQLDDLGNQITSKTEALQAVSDHLKLIGTDPAQPVPPVPPEVVNP